MPKLGARSAYLKALLRRPLGLGFTQRPHSSSSLALPYRILNMSPQKELLWSLRVEALEAVLPSGSWQSWGLLY